MKYLKTYEDLQQIPQVGDYVLCKDYITSDIETRIDSNIGKISNYDDINEYYTIIYDSKYKNSILYKKTGGNGYMRRGIRQHSIIMWSKNKEDIEAYIQSKKYNL